MSGRIALLRRPVGAALTCAALLVLAGGCAPSDTAAPAAAAVELPTGFPQDFPIPANAVSRNQGGVLNLRVTETSVDDLKDFYNRELVRAGWTVEEEWTGVDPQGRPTVGLIIDLDGETGAVALIDAGEGTVEVQANLNQPTLREGDA